MHEGDDERTRAPTTQTKSELVVVWPGGHVVVPITKESMVVGRGSTSDIIIPHATVSRAHAKITFGDGVRIEDLGSSHGTRIAGERIEGGRSMAVSPGTSIEIGDATLFLRGAVASPGPATMDRARALAEKIAPSNITVLILGETGVGKGVLAAAIHAASPRADHEMVSINCGAIVPTLLEAELFGHERGAFTGATRSRPGLVEQASGSTLLLDEVAELTPDMQVKLLHVVERKEVTRVGADRPIGVDARFIAATHRSLEDMVRAGTFREDLYYRLNGIAIRIPPLRERTEEIIPIAERVLEQHGKGKRLSPDAKAVLLRHSWPGNIRELVHAIERAIVLSDGPELLASSLDLRAREGGSLRTDLSAVERSRIIEALERHAGNQTLAAKDLGMPRRTLLRRLDELGIPRPRKSRR